MIAKLVIQTTAWLVAMAVLLFVPAGRIDWPGAWAFLIEMAAMGFGIGFWLARHMKDIPAPDANVTAQAPAKAMSEAKDG